MMQSNLHTVGSPWRRQSDEEIHRRLEATRRLYQRTLSQWAVDLLRLRQQGIRWASWPSPGVDDGDRLAA